MPRKRLRTLQGALFGVFAAPGWALLHCVLDPRLRLADDVAAHAGLYAYLAVGAMAGFAVFGALLGHHEDALLDANRRLDELAVTDPLTGLKNVRYFRARLAEAGAASQRAGEPLSLLVLDLDAFKEVNDRHGHVTGDRVLCRVAEVLRAGVRDGDTAARLDGNVARMGGEEFAVLLPGATAAEAARIGERLRNAIGGAAVATDTGPVGVTASVGVVTLEPGVLVDELYGRADRAMYASKAAGRNRVTAWGRP